MRWIPFLILAYAVVLVETSVGWLLFIDTSSLGAVGPDLAAMVAVFVAFYARGASDAMLAAWILGLAVDLTCGGGIGSPTVVGPMSIAYCLAAGLLWRMREAFFRERALTQAILAFAFVAIAHGIWATAQAILAPGHVGLGDYGRTLLQVLAVAGATAVLMPLAHYVLRRCQRFFLVSAVGPGRRMRR
jgi:rod shape-determining protein MreD